MEELAVCVVPSAFLVAIFGTIVLVRWFKHREILAMVEKGLLPAQIALVMLGLALMIGLWPIGFMRAGVENPYPLGFGPWMLAGLIPLFIGLALLIIYFLTRKEETLAPEMTSVEEGEISGD